MSGVKSRLVEADAVETPFRPTAAIPKSDVQAAVEAIQTDLSTVEATLLAAQLIVAAAHAGLGAERVLTATATISWDSATTAQMKANVVDASITFAKLQNISTDKLIGRDTASSGVPEEIGVGGGIEFTGSGALQTSAFTGDATKAAGGTALTLATVNSNVGQFGSASAVSRPTVNGKGLVTAIDTVAIAIASTAVTDFTEAVQDVIGALFVDSSEINWAYDDGLNTVTQNLIDGSVALSRLANQAALTVLANATNGSAAVTALAAAANDRLLTRVSDVLAFTQLTVGMFPANVVTLAKIAQGTALSVLGVTAGSTADYADIAAGTDHQVLRRSGSVVAFGAVNLAQSAAVTGQLVSTSMPALTGAVASAGGTLSTTATFDLVVSIDGGGSAITTGIKAAADFHADFAFTITAWTLFGDTSGAIKIDIWKDTYANYPPDNSDSMTNAHEPEITASGVKAQDTDLSDWTTTSVAAGAVLRFNVDSVTSITAAVLILKCTKTS